MLAVGVLLASSAVAALAAHCAVNTRFGLRRPPTDPPVVDQPVAVLIPARDEAHRIGACLRAVLGQRGVPRLDVVVLDDESTDGTANEVAAVAGSDPRVQVITGTPPPSGWVGKSHACQQLADAVPGASVLVFLDADVVLARHALASYVALLGDADLLSPLVGMDTLTWSERLFVAPHLSWTWLTFLPLWAMRRTRRTPAWLAVAAGQVLVFRRAGYDAAGGFATVSGSVVEDLGIARAVARAGGRVTLANGATLARCRMYTSWPDLANGFAKTLCGLFPRASGLGFVALLSFLYLLPPLAAVSGSAVGLAGYLLAVASRVVTARSFRDRWWPDAFAHPAFVALGGWLVARAYWQRRRGTLAWKGRPVLASRLRR